MRYIRTKNTIYDGSRYLREYTCEYFNENSKLYAFTESEIIKESDNLEELCDAFVFEDTDKTKWVLKNCETAKTLNNGDLFGAIWTDKGLIYKAKMRGVLLNGKIDWELL